MVPCYGRRPHGELETRDLTRSLERPHIVEVSPSLQPDRRVESGLFALRRRQVPPGISSEATIYCARHSA
jgi:hypothetical protein